MSEHDTSHAAPLFCDRCQRELRPGRGEFYVVSIEAVADPTPPSFTEEDLEVDYKAEIARIVEHLHDLSAQEAMDQVYRKVTLYLCVPCFEGWIEDPAR
jgi:hypothetical protein